MSPLHVVLGAGQVGPRVAALLLERGYRVRIARRSTAPSAVNGADDVVLDVRDAHAVAHAAEGADVVYHCVNPLYHQWPELLLPMTRGIVEGTARAGARLVALDCLYMYGDTARMHERSPMAPVSRKGRLRQMAAELMLEADARGSVPVAIGRAADFFGPATPLSLFGERFFRRILAGKSAQFFGHLDAPHSYSFTPDVAAGLVALGCREHARGVWMLPLQPAETTRAVLSRFAHALGREIPASILPTWLLRAAGLVDPILRELAEMTYQWQQPFVVDDSQFRQSFGFGATPWQDAIAQTVRWGRATYAGQGLTAEAATA